MASSLFWKPSNKKLENNANTRKYKRHVRLKRWKESKIIKSNKYLDYVQHNQRLMLEKCFFKFHDM
jgi:hypothetical protein